MNSISIMLSEEELEIFYLLVCDELEFQVMNYEEEPTEKLKALQRKILQKRLFLLGDK
tara:strand:+ start:1626 stop:1799 length:174 start_codon:yes stop_codon:yes gene_type:complete